MLLFWPLVGALIGAYAAQKKGFSTVGGVVGGVLLGPLAFLLFFVSGIVSASEQQRKCPYCAEWIKPEATICKHCHKDVEPQPVPQSRTSPVLIGVLVVLVALVVIGAFIAVTDGGVSSGGASSVLNVGKTVTMGEFNQLQTGMSYEETVQIIGAPGEELSRSEIAGISTIMYAWKNYDGSNMNAMFQNGGLVNKAQFGLQ